MMQTQKLPKSQDFVGGKGTTGILNVSKMSSVSTTLQTKEEKIYPLDIRDIK